MLPRHHVLNARYCCCWCMTLPVCKSASGDNWWLRTAHFHIQKLTDSALSYTTPPRLHQPIFGDTAVVVVERSYVTLVPPNGFNALREDPTVSLPARGESATESEDAGTANPSKRGKRTCGAIGMSSGVRRRSQQPHK
ncbi:hypothetical protein NDU88_004046 [Pleurodeles waltl]|uniref:Secreted protein n=1 Tax=Pleurodeles waltl TaxID=8319 RepID=A0AAV7KWL3_PLEWA|nr:hypothetical protein NDU88_004046 [Pleurodeles waltl]